MESLSLSEIHPASKKELNSEELQVLSLPAATDSKTVTKEILSCFDAFVLSDVLTGSQCDFLVEKSEELNKYSPWNQQREKARKDFRDADTIECTHNALANALWERMKDGVQQSLCIDASHPYFEKELEGEWEAVGINPNLLLGRYLSGGHFAPHTDGCTVIDFNYRTLYTVLVYLNDCKEGGRTHVYADAQLHDLVLNENGVYTGKKEHLLASAKPIKGSAFVFYHAHCHEGEPVGDGSAKYFIRTDVLYKRKIPICNQPNDIEAYRLYNEAKRLSLEDPMEAMKIFRRAFKLSPTLANVFDS